MFDLVVQGIVSLDLLYLSLKIMLIYYKLGYIMYG